MALTILGWTVLEQCPLVLPPFSLPPSAYQLLRLAPHLPYLRCLSVNASLTGATPQRA